MDIPGLDLLEAADPVVARRLESLVRRLAAAVDADRWAGERLPALAAAGTRARLLSRLVDHARDAAGAGEVFAVLWNGDPARGTASFLAVAGESGLVPAPDRVSRTVIGEAVARGRAIWVDDPARDARFASAESVVASGAGVLGCVPLGPQGALYIAGQGDPGRLDARVRARIEALARVAAALVRLPDEPPPGEAAVPGLVGSSRPMGEVAAAVRSFARMPWPALVLGETGTGKEAVARALHDLSGRAGEPFVAVNCAAIPEELAESSFFGHERGAFTGAERRHEGVVERTRGGTLFLDEVGELPARLQAKLLRLLQEGTFERVGGDKELRFRGRVVAATLRPLDQEGGRGAFRGDLYHRLSACILRVPPLRDRRDDIPALAAHLLKKARAEVGDAPEITLSEEAVRDLERREWTGNVRELENVIRAALARALAWGDSILVPEHLDDPRPGPPAVARSGGEVREADAGGPLIEATERFQRRLVREALETSQGNRLQAAARLGVSKQWLYRLLARWGGNP